jgi:hypothetical protein
LLTFCEQEINLMTEDYWDDEEDQDKDSLGDEDDLDI